ncbi:MAG: class III signal peptide-containing protein [Candidatus Micrarchaeia archaeon]
MRRGQGSTEYLVLLAVALIIALVVIGLLGWFPGLAGGARETQSKAYWKGANPFGIIEYKINGTSVSLALRNNEDAKLTVTDVELDGGSLNVSDTDFRGGEEKLVTGTLATSCGSPGTAFEYNVTIIYNSRSISGNKQIGEKPLIGKCS